MTRAMPLLLPTLLSLLSLFSPARADSVSSSDAHPAVALARDLIAAAQARTLDEAWWRARVDPGPAGWTAHHTAVWRHALRPGGPTDRVLSQARGIRYLAPVDARHTHVVLDTQPRLLVRVRDDGKLTHLGPTACDTCPEAERWVRDLLLSLRSAGGGGSRLRVATDLDLADHLARHRNLAGHRWPALLDRRLRDDRGLRRQIAQAQVLQTEGMAVRLRLADGPEDRWTVAFDEGRGRIVYDALPPSSPLRLSLIAARRWRSLDHRAAARAGSWDPSWRRMSDGIGVEIGHGAVGAVVDPTDETVLLVALDPDLTLSHLYRVDPWTQRVLARIRLPTPSTRQHLPVPGWTTGWPLALSPDASALAISTPRGLVLVDLATEEVTSHGRLPGRITALAWRTPDRLVIGLDDGHLRQDGEDTVVAPRVPILAIAPTAETSLDLLLADGRVMRLDDGVPTERTRVCPGAVRSVVQRHEPGMWGLTCRSGKEVAVDLGRSLGATPSAGTPSLPPTAEEGPLVSVSVDTSGDRLVGLTAHGRVGWWELTSLPAPTRGASP